MKLSILLVLTFLLIPSEKIKVWKEKKGIVVLEAEHSQDRNDLPVYWSTSTAFQGYTGTGFLRWSGAGYINDDFSNVDEERIITYYVAVETEGVYYIKLKGTIFDEVSANVLVKIDNSEWKKFTIQNNGSVSWDVNTVSDSYPVFMQNDYHKIEIAGISSGFMFDKFALIHESLIDPSSDMIDTSIIDGVKESRSQYLPEELFTHLQVKAK